MKTIDTGFFPGWVRKSITFTIDDGNVHLDRKFLDITKPAGLKGTFNLNTPLKRLTPEEYREFYRDYEIANHCEYHPFMWNSEKHAREIKQESFCKETADPLYAYLADAPGLLRICNEWGSWHRVATNRESYLRCVQNAQKELESVFGKGSVKDYVWPYYEQKDPILLQELIDMGFRSIRKTGCVKDSTGFALPSNRMAWSYNAHNNNLNEIAKLYEAFPDDGELKFFCFGVHSHDFENDNNWDVLVNFCEKYGNRPTDFWYASVGDIFDYEDAVKSLIVTDTELINDSLIDLYVKIDNTPIMIKARSEYKL